jgi:hypothetical protein
LVEVMMSMSRKRLTVWGGLAVLGALAFATSGCDDAGESCDTGADCSSGICEGLGCGQGEGVCAAEGRSCTDDNRPYCGCDGNTFYDSGSCAGARYEHEGVCE